MSGILTIDKNFTIDFVPSGKCYYYEDFSVRFRVTVDKDFVLTHPKYKVAARWRVFDWWEETYGTKIDEETWDITICLFQDDLVSNDEIEKMEVAFFLQYGNEFEDLSVPWAINDPSVVTLWENNDGKNFIFCPPKGTWSKGSFETYGDGYTLNYTGPQFCRDCPPSIENPWCTVRLRNSRREGDKCFLELDVQGDSNEFVDLGIRYAMEGDWSKGRSFSFGSGEEGTRIFSFFSPKKIEFAVFAKYMSNHGIEIVWDNNNGKNFKL